jgi:hypothetical protein
VNAETPHRKSGGCHSIRFQYILANHGDAHNFIKWGIAVRVVDMSTSHITTRSSYTAIIQHYLFHNLAEIKWMANADFPRLTLRVFTIDLHIATGINIEVTKPF